MIIVFKMCLFFFGLTDLSGSQDGSVNLWEWKHQSALASPRSSGTFAKVTKIAFNQIGNKFGVTDGDGNLSLWQVAFSSSGSKPFFVSTNVIGKLVDLILIRLTFLFTNSVCKFTLNKQAILRF